MDIVYAIDSSLSTEEFLTVLINCLPEDTGSVVSIDRLNQMLRNADIVITARCQGKLVGVSRALTDFCYCCYLADLAVDVAYQRRGIGRALVEKTRTCAGENATLFVVAFPPANAFYSRLGLQSTPNCWSTRVSGD